MTAGSSECAGRMLGRATLTLAFAAIAFATTTGSQSVAAAATHSIEMVDLIRMFMQPKSGPDSLGDWTFGAQPGSPIRWKTNGIQETSREEQKAGYPYHRTGEAVLTIGGEFTHKVLEKNVVPGRWTITLLGPHGGFTRAVLSGRIADGSVQVLEGLEHELPLRHYRCKTPSVSSGNKVFVVQETSKKPIWINEEWSCGSGGCGLTLDIVFTKEEADRFECF